ncbi:kinetochore scaffold 1 isoform X2 [Mastomys coucha]|uniref:kinetochore scaffold 1 isoform X2 n=1 Tax=Mastomys coucha TaxID=35658 RepID=UPI0012614A94|nr:kinetochore scaffold 1 isoform X2 [Mastomys coucha]
MVCLMLRIREEKKFSEMDGIYSEANEENDNTQRHIKRQHSSILKPPRSPLQDLKCGNEIVQESNAPRTRKSTRRVSFADTIKVFQPESHMKTERNSETSETEARDDVLTLQNKNLDDNYCEITGMNTLLCAPIQTHMQQKEFSIIDCNRERKHANDQTVIFSDENQMDLTASHTVMITKGLSDCTKNENSTKIDTTSFLENLKHHAANSRIKRDLACPTISIGQNIFSEKINSDNFIKRLKTELDKENAEIPVYSKDSNSASSTQQMHASHSVDENSNRTRIFREQDDGMNLTQCHTACIQTWIPPSREANLGESKGDNTIYGNECMELTTNYTIQVLSSENNLSERETQTQNCMNVTTVDGATPPEKKTALKDKLNAAFQGSFPNPENKIHITKCHSIESETHTVTQISNQSASTLAITSESIYSSPAIQGYKTIFYSSSNDAMELTKCLSSMQEEKKLLKADNKYSKICTNPDAGPLREKTIYPEEDSMDITKSHTVAIDNKIFKHDQENIKKEITAIPIFEKEMMIQNLIPMSKDEKLNVNFITVPQVSKERLQQSLTNADKEMEFSTGKDMDLTKSHTTKLSQVIPTTFDLASKNVTKSYSQSKSPSDEWESLDKQVVLGQHSKLPLPQRKNVDDPDCSHHKIMYSEEAQTMDLTKSHTIVIGFGPSEIQEHSKIKLEHRNSQLTAESRQTPVNIPGGNSRVVTTNDMDMLKDRSIHKPELLKEKQNIKIYGRKSTGGLKIDKTILFSEDNEDDMDITKSCTVKINHRSLLDKHDSHLVSLAGTSKTILHAHGQVEMEINRTPITPLECKIISPNDITPGDLNKTVMSIDDHEELEMTKSHTVFIDYQAEAKGVLPDRIDFQLSKKESLQKPKVTSTPAEEIVSISKNSESNHVPAKGSQPTILEGGSNSGPEEETNDAQKPGFLNELLSGKIQRRKSLSLKNKTIIFPENDKSNRDITQSSVVEISNETRLQDRKGFNFVPLAGTSKPVLSAYRPMDLEISKSQTTASEYKTVAPDQITTIPMDKTVMFVDDLCDLDVTRSHTVFIDCQAKEKVFHEYTNLGIQKTKNLSGSEGDTCSQEITKKPVAEHEHHMTTVIPSNTLFSDQSSMKIKFHKADIGEEVKGKEEESNTLKQTKPESCPLNITDGKNVDFTADVCRSSDKYSSLPNISFSDNLNGNTMSLYDKNKEKAYNCQVPNEFAYVEILPSTYHMDSEKLSVFAPCPSKEVTQAESAIALHKDQDLIEEHLGEMAKFNSKHASHKLAKDQVDAFVDVSVASQSHLSAQQPPSTQKGQDVAHRDEGILSKAGENTLPFLIGNVSVSTCVNESKMPTNVEHFAITYKEELNKSIQKDNCSTNVHSPSNSALTTQVIQTHANGEEALDSIVPSNVSCFSSAKPSLSNLNRKTEEVLDFQTVHLLPPAEQLPEEGSQAHSMSIVQATEIYSLGSSNDRKEASKTSCNKAETTSVPPKAAVKDKMRRCSLGIFLPRLPNKRSCSITGVDDLEQILADATDLTHLETQPVCSKDPGTGSVAAKLNSCLSQCINEENLPIDPDEIPSSDSVSLDIEEIAPIDTSHKEILPPENKTETCRAQKRTCVQENDVTNEKKIRTHDSAQDQEIFDNHTEEDINKNVNSVLLKSLSRTPSSCSSSLDSIKSDGLTLDVSTQRNSHMESQFLGDTICEESLREKLKDGQITIKEFFILLQVHILIQKPRQSTLPAKFTINTLPTTEDLMLRQYVYGPKIQIYREDCELLRQKIEELKVSALNQDKLLVDVNRNLWGKVKDYSDEELKNYGIYLNKIKSRYTKMTKVFTHQGKVALYSKLVHSAENEKKKLQIKINEMDSILKKINNCLTEVEKETTNLENEEKNDAMEEWDSKMRDAEKELEQLKTEEEELQRKFLEVETQKAQTLAQIEFIKEQTTKTEELLDQLSLSEWDIIEWSDNQAVFTFVYDSIELIITFGEPLVGLPFLDNPCRKINKLSFQSLLDDKAPPSSRLVHKLIFQYIEEQESWKKKCTAQHEVPQMLQELSLVVNRCRLLGEEIEFLNRWGPNYSLMHINVNNTELKLLFSNSAAFAKFEITLSSSAHYPLVPLPFTIQNHLGKTGHDEIAAIISKVPLEENYLKNVVKQIYQDLLKD